MSAQSKTQIIPPPEPKSLKTAYLLWLFGGIFGAHRFYLRRPTTANFYLATLGVLFFGWVWDLVYTYFMVQKYNHALADKRADNGAEPAFEQEEDPELSEDLPEWMKDEDPFTMLVGYVECIVAVVLIGGLYLILLQANLAVVFLFFTLFWALLIFGNFALRINKAVLFAKDLQINLDNISNILRLEGHFFKHKPYSIFQYLLFPLTLPLFWRTERGRREILLFIRLWIGAAALLTGLLLYSYFLERSYVSPWQYLHLESLHRFRWLLLLSGLSLGLIVLILKNKFRHRSGYYRYPSTAFNFFSTVCLVTVLLLEFFSVPIMEFGGTDHHYDLLMKKYEHQDFRGMLADDTRDFLSLIDPLSVQSRIIRKEDLLRNLDTEFRAFLARRSRLRLPEEQANLLSFDYQIPRGSSEARFTLSIDGTFRPKQVLIDSVQIGLAHLLRP